MVKFPSSTDFSFHSCLLCSKTSNSLLQVEIKEERKSFSPALELWPSDQHVEGEVGIRCCDASFSLRAHSSSPWNFASMCMRPSGVISWTQSFEAFSDSHSRLLHVLPYYPALLFLGSGHVLVPVPWAAAIYRMGNSFTSGMWTLAK